jgi:sugar O-acyltransferase (sialic acid O-acetyltransferase NeuD family)
MTVARMPILIIGAGGHAKVLADALMAAGRNLIGFTDTDAARHGQRLLGLPIFGSDQTVLANHDPASLLLVNGIGGTSGGTRRCQVDQAVQASGRGWVFTAVHHPSVIVSTGAELAHDVQLLAGSIIQSGAMIGRGSIVNTGAIVEHDCRVGEYVHIAPGSILCGYVTIGDRSHIGAGAVVKNSVALGADTIVGAGACVIGPFSGGGTLTGVPARRVTPDERPA